MGVKTILISDISGEQLQDGTKPVVLTYNNQSVELYLTKKELSALEKALSTYLELGTPVETVKKSAPAKTDGVDKKAARAWLQANGYKLGDRGRIPQEMIDAYLKAN